MFHAVAQCVAYVKMMGNACILKAAYKIMRTVGYTVFRRTSGFLRGFVNDLFDIIPFEVVPDVHTQYGDIIMIQWFACMFSRNTQNYKKFLLVNHDAFIDYVSILTALWSIILIDGESELANPVGYRVVARELPQWLSGNLLKYPDYGYDGSQSASCPYIDQHAKHY